ncbi:TetR/AcrR family transcriptional regulator [Vibrio intestinalis]|uniref:TetR/AcrR family transcriptional regulator n=1 Tax=Vibrio intestinalis TaxID=2933291 RepID=UPI0021A2E37A|nr:TetR/AcrR family transcriptional regulator [Vibrio intestinalis]
MSKKRQLLVDTALNLFYHQGVHAIGINEILKTSGVAKRTLYSHFESKDALLLAALQQRHTTFIDWLTKQLAHSHSNAEVIDQLFTSLEKWFAGKAEELGDFRGCFFINTAGEFSHIQCEIIEYCAMHKAKVREVISGKLSGEPPHLLDAICTMKEGTITLAHLTGDISHCEKAKAVLQRLI